MVNAGMKSAAPHVFLSNRQKLGDPKVDMRKKKGNKTRVERPCYDLDRLLEQITPENQLEPLDDAPVGEEKL